MNRDRMPGNGTPYKRAPGNGRRIGFYCRHCNRAEESQFIPVGWYALNRTAGDDGKARLGVYCCARCLARALPGIVADEDAMGDDWADRVSLNRWRNPR